MRIMWVLLSFSVAFLSPVSKAATPSLAIDQVKEKVFELASKTQQLFNIKFKIWWSDQQDCGPSAMWTSVFSIKLCTIDLVSLSTHLTPEEIMENYYMTLLHEVAHGIVSWDQGRQVALDEEFDLAMSKVSNYTTAEISDRRAILFHEDVDSLTAKLARHFGINMLGYIKSFELFELHESLSAEEKLMVKAQLPGRILAMKTGFNEGWSDWSNFHAVSPICDNGGFRSFLRENSFLKILEIIGAPCGPMKPQINFMETQCSKAILGTN